MSGQAALPGPLELAIQSRTVAEWLGEQGIETVQLGLFDASGTLRQKRLSPAAAARAMEQGWSFIDTIEWWGPDDRLWHQRGSGTAAATVDLHSGRAYPFGAAASLFLAEFEPPLCDLSPRAQLRRMTTRAADVGVAATAGWEFECIVLENDPAQADRVVPAMAANHCWSAVTLAHEAELLDDLVGTLSAGGVPVDHLCAELGPGCLEIATGPEPALLAADSAALAKVYTKAFFAQRGLQATFMAQLGEGFPGLGGHPSLSLHSTLDGSPVLTDSTGELSKSGSAAIAGVVTLLPELLAMVAPYPNSYRRFGPGNWAPATATWGMGNYSCALRVVADDPRSARLELRIPGADASPHLGLAMFLGAALWGMEEHLDPPPPVVAPDDGRADVSGTALPRDLTEAADRFSRSDVARDLFGPAFVDHYAASRRAEVAACHRFVSSHERARYLDYV